MVVTSMRWAWMSRGSAITAGAFHLAPSAPLLGSMRRVGEPLVQPHVARLAHAAAVASLLPRVLSAPHGSRYLTVEPTRRDSEWHQRLVLLQASRRGPNAAGISLALLPCRSLRMFLRAARAWHCALRARDRTGSSTNIIKTCSKQSWMEHSWSGVGPDTRSSRANGFVKPCRSCLARVSSQRAQE